MTLTPEEKKQLWLETAKLTMANSILKPFIERDDWDVNASYATQAATALIVAIEEHPEIV